MNANPPPCCVLAEPFTEQEAADFEQLIFASNNPDPKIRLLARATLSAFVTEHGKTKCDMMIVHLSKFHDDKDKRPDA